MTREEAKNEIDLLIIRYEIMNIKYLNCKTDFERSCYRFIIDTLIDEIQYLRKTYNIYRN